MRTLITGGTIARPDGVFDADILLDEGRILELGERLHASPAAEGVEIVDVTGCIVMPGGVDIHTHLNLNRGEDRVADGFAAGTQAAAWGGTTTLVEHLDFGPEGCDLFHVLNMYKEQAWGQCAVDYAFHGVAQHVDEAILEQIPDLVEQGFPSLKAYTTYGSRIDDAAMLQLLQALEAAGGLLMVHAENEAIIQYLQKKLGQIAPDAPASHSQSRPAVCEAEAINRVLSLASIARAAVYIVHVSTAAGLEHIRRARRNGVTVIAETCPQYLLLTDVCYNEEDGLKYVMAPPLRQRTDCLALWEGLKDGTLSVVATDHCAFSLASKQQAETVFQCPGGVPGVETRIPLLFSEGVLRGRLTLPRLVDVVATTPARLMGLCDKGRLEPGADADVTVLDPGDERLIKAATLHQQTDFTPYEGMVIRGWPRHVWLRGESILRDREYCGNLERGRLVHRHPCFC